MSLTAGPVEVAAIRSAVAARRGAPHLCSNGHNSGTVREWYNGQAIDAGPSRDAGGRVVATLGGENEELFQRSQFVLLPDDGSARASVDVSVNGGVSCPARPYTPFGVWSISVP